jgi:hypothetical protein
MKKNSAIFSFQAEQTLDEFRDRLIEWQHKPSRAKKLFKQDLEQWKYSTPSAEQELSVQQQEWAASNRAAEVATAALPLASRPSAEPRDVTPAVPPVTVASSTPTTAKPEPLAPAVTPQPLDTDEVPVASEPKPYTNTDLGSYSPPMTASAVRARINPPTDD